MDLKMHGAYIDGKLKNLKGILRVFAPYSYWHICNIKGGGGGGLDTIKYQTPAKIKYQISRVHKNQIFGNKNIRYQISDPKKSIIRYHTPLKYQISDIKIPPYTRTVYVIYTLFMWFIYFVYVIYTLFMWFIQTVLWDLLDVLFTGFIHTICMIYIYCLWDLYQWV